MRIPLDNDIMAEDQLLREPNSAQLLAKKHLKIDMMDILRKMVAAWAYFRALIFRIPRNLRHGFVCRILITIHMMICRWRKESLMNADACSKLMENWIL